MASIQVNINESVFETETDGRINVKIASNDNGIPNRISMNADNKLVCPKSSGGSGGTMNTPGNGIIGEPNKSISVIRCNNTVSRLRLEADTDEGLLMSTIIENILMN
jgi:hypothetical protein